MSGGALKNNVYLAFSLSKVWLIIMGAHIFPSCTWLKYYADDINDPRKTVFWEMARESFRDCTTETTPLRNMY